MPVTVEAGIGHDDHSRLNRPAREDPPRQRILAFAAFSYLSGDDSVSSALDHCRQLDERKGALLSLIRVAEIRGVLRAVRCLQSEAVACPEPPPGKPGPGR